MRRNAPKDSRAGKAATSPQFSQPPRSASCPGDRSARSGPKSVTDATVEARDAACLREAEASLRRRQVPARLGAALRQGASSRLPDARTSRRAAFLPCRRDSTAQTMEVVRNAGWRRNAAGRARGSTEGREKFVTGGVARAFWYTYHGANRSYPVESMAFYRVSQAVNNIHNNDPSCTAPLKAAAINAI